MSTQHTPGPWTLETVKTQIGICHCIGPFPPLRPGSKPSYACIYVDGRYKPEQDPLSLANARLIAAAPDLLEACKNMLHSLKIAGLNDTQAEVAIAKAEGREP